MNKDESIKETLDVIRRALEDENPKDLNQDILILNRQVNDDGTIKIIKSDTINKDEIKNILDEKISNIFDKHLDKLLEEKLPKYIQKYLENK